MFRTTTTTTALINVQISTHTLPPPIIAPMMIEIIMEISLEILHFRASRLLAHFARFANPTYHVPVKAVVAVVLVVAVV